MNKYEYFAVSVYLTWELDEPNIYRTRLAHEMRHQAIITMQKKK